MGIKVLKIEADILGANKELAHRNRGRFSRHGLVCINIMSSPGSGKTSLILQTIQRLKGQVGLGVIEGDIASKVDADKIDQQGVPVIQINTGGGCHLDANMIDKALNDLPVDIIDLLFIENVGNLVCPAEFDLGEDRKVMLLSVPEGDDKPHKYPLMFSEVDVVLVNKIDVLPHFDFNMEAFDQTVSGLNPKVKIFPISCKTGEGLEAWTAWLSAQIDLKAISIH
jgi:hydrogenase nickel incorporation protein HypB